MFSKQPSDLSISFLEIILNSNLGVAWKIKMTGRLSSTERVGLGLYGLLMRRNHRLHAVLTTEAIHYDTSSFSIESINRCACPNYQGDIIGTPEPIEQLTDNKWLAFVQDSKLRAKRELLNS